MPLTKMQKRLVGAAICSFASFLVDALFLGPSGAAGSSENLLSANAQAAAGAIPTTRRSDQLQSFGAPGVQCRLVAATQSARDRFLTPRDVFHPNGISKPAAEVQVDSSVQRKPAPIDPAIDFLSRHKLRAVMISGGQSVALINDRLLRVGEVVGGFKIISIEKKFVTLEKGGISLRINLSDVINLTDGSSR